jgi:hypothetical protein
VRFWNSSGLDADAPPAAYQALVTLRTIAFVRAEFDSQNIRLADYRVPQ